MDRSLEQLLAELASAIGSQQIDARDGHARWALYRSAMDAGQRPDLLLDAVRAEPDNTIALSLTLSMLERVPSGTRTSWVSRLSAEKDREYAMNRAAELAILESALAGELASVATLGIPEGWSHWLQLRLAKECSDEQVLQLLRDRGRTRRIRQYARERMEGQKAE